MCVCVLSGFFNHDKKLAKFCSTFRMRTVFKNWPFYLFAQNGITEMQHLPEWGSTEDFQEWWILNYYLIDCDVE